MYSLSLNIINWRFDITFLFKVPWKERKSDPFQDITIGGAWLPRQLPGYLSTWALTFCGKVSNNMKSTLIRILISKKRRTVAAFICLCTMCGYLTRVRGTLGGPRTHTPSWKLAKTWKQKLQNPNCSSENESWTFASNLWSLLTFLFSLTLCALFEASKSWFFDLN